MGVRRPCLIRIQWTTGKIPDLKIRARGAENIKESIKIGGQCRYQRVNIIRKGFLARMVSLRRAEVFLMRI